MSRILTVDDSPLICSLIEEILSQEENVSIQSVYTGGEALESIRVRRPDLILMDVMLPDANGYELCKLLKNEWMMGDVPIIFLTAKNDATCVVEGFHAGAVDYICKPFSTIELKARVLCHLRNKLMSDKLKELEMAKELLRQQGLQDPLTNIYNRRYFIENLDSWYSEVIMGRKISILMADIDDFKHINDTYGHAAGDDVLIMVADILRKAVGARGIAGRWGGEEFLVVLLDTDGEQAMKIAQIICQTIHQFDFTSKDLHIRCSITIGVTECTPEVGMDKTFLYVDEALYQGKSTGKNCCVFL